jgi:RepB plasmid partitioning protein/Beta-lactamase
MTGVPATPDMHFHNGNVAVAYLATVLLQLQDRGVISLDDRLSKWFPDYPKSDQVTLRMLINCTSGYADYVSLETLPLYEDVLRQWTPDELIAIALGQPMACDPGTCFNYAHTNFVILGEVLRKASGKPVEKMRPARQIEAAELMLAANNFSEAYARALLAATPQDQLVNAQAKRISGVSFEQMARLEREMANLQRDLKIVEDSYGDDVLNLVVARGYLAKLLKNPNVARYLQRHQADIACELQDPIETIGQKHTGAG